MEVIQVIPNPQDFVEGRPTMVRVSATSSHADDKNALIRITARDMAGNLFVALSSFHADAGSVHRFEWRFSPVPAPFGSGFSGAGESTEAETLETRSYVFVSQDNGDSWVPVGAYLPGEEFTFEAQQGGRYWLRVFATSGFELQDVQSESDIDLDGCGDSVDPDPDVADFDGVDVDGIAEVCDACPGVYDPMQVDRDSDGPGDACDNCVDVANTTQTNNDLDPRGDACDCSPFDATTWELPLGIFDLTVAKSVAQPGTLTLDWGSLAAQAGPSVGYDVVHGGLEELRTSGGSFDDTMCTADDLGADLLDGVDVPLQPGEGAWLLVRGVNDCGEGTYGSGGVGQVGDRDQAIALAAQACP
jgi:hypothetical protein